MHNNTLANDAMGKHNSHRLSYSSSVKSSLNQSAFIHAIGSYIIPGVFSAPL